MMEPTEQVGKTSRTGIDEQTPGRVAHFDKKDMSTKKALATGNLLENDENFDRIGEMSCGEFLVSFNLPIF